MHLRQIISNLIAPHLKSKTLAVLEILSLVKPCVNSSTRLLDFHYKRIGILNFETDAISGEIFLVDRILSVLIKSPRPTLLDVGANAGDYTAKLFAAFPTATIHAFEPSPQTYAKLICNFTDPRVYIVPEGLGEYAKTAEFFDYGDKLASTHASLYADVFKLFHKTLEVRSFPVKITTLDDYCAVQNLSRIDFIKIDTEGNELSVLKGATRLIANGGLPLIQFEFNEMNIVSRSFLKDFYDLLEGYTFFRLMPEGLLPLGSYNPRNEIFAFQNIFAVQPGYPDSDQLSTFLVPPLSYPPLAQAGK